MEKQLFWGTGKRKKAIARVRLTKGTGNITINKKNFQEYFSQEIWIEKIRKPLELTSSLNQYDIFVNVSGGGKSGQVNAVCLGIARSLIKIDMDLKPVLKKAGLLERDARIKERKKYGQPKARKRFQFSKR